MSRLNTLTTTFAMVLGLAISHAALGQHQGHHHGSAPAAAPQPAASAELPWAEAEIRRVDLAAGKLSLRHGEIKNLEMPPMTMVFTVQDKSSMEGLKAGDRIRFTADQVQGTYTVLKLEKLP
ncbi:MAG TPA: copper-binding protein [Hydrogenophaga sp.]|uniref:copper-binding protein n=1 Tax=Hydrogenophaga sp. TaxID=1904254 RepID=UPI002C553904|nr:copper-binding protein [Hydrogenophaga sp.]HMN94617.1 copper-binding protein [Hydrogenophaga sp.]HMP09707.1 copper-binding protein [Hydrogenophaga sp.]